MCRTGPLLARRLGRICASLADPPLFEAHDRAGQEVCFVEQVALFVLALRVFEPRFEVATCTLQVVVAGDVAPATHAVLQCTEGEGVGGDGKSLNQSVAL